jgi:hypothetical protein
MKSIITSALQNTSAEPELSLEERFLEEMDDQTELTVALEALEVQMLRLEEIEDTMDELESLQASLESLIETKQYGGINAEMVQERFVTLEQRANVEYDAPSFEGIAQGGLEEAELTLEAVSGIWNRIKQAYVSTWHSLMDEMGGLIKGVDKFAAKHVKLAQQLRKEWAVKKTKISGRPIKGSLAGGSVSATFVLNNQFVKAPVQALSTDVGHAKYALADYLPAMSKYLDQVRSIVERGDYSTDAKFEETVLKSMVGLTHPRDVFKLPIVDKGVVLLRNRGYETKAGKPVKPVAAGKEYHALANLLVKRHVRQYISNTAGALHDIYFDPKDVDVLLTHYETLAGLLEDTTGRLSMSLKAAKDIVEINTDRLSGNYLSGTNKKAVKQIGKFVKQLPLYLNRPIKKEINRVSGVVSGTRTLISRTIATAQ